MEQWFPRPTTPEEIVILRKPGEIFTKDEEHALRSSIFSSLTSKDAVEWQDKVGVISPREGSGKASTRLLFSDDLVWKTDTSLCKEDLEEACAWARQMHNLANRLDIWHPQKRWFVLNLPNGALPVSSCPRMETLRAAQSWPEMVYGWGEMLGWSLEIASRLQVSLDMNPSNFAFDESRRRLYYLDDEHYERFVLADLGESIISRIPEYPDVLPATWLDWGNALRDRLSALLLERDQWREIAESIEDYPLVGRYHESRKALLQGLRGTSAGSVKSRTLEKKDPQVFCIFSDIHGNATALEAVLKEAKRLGAEHYLCLGDIVGYGPHPKECVRRLMSMEDLSVIRGNHDQMVGLGGPEDGCNRLARASTEWTVAQLDDEERAWLLSLPLELRGEGWLAVHGAPIDSRRVYAYVYEMNYRDNLDFIRNEGTDICFYGHTHVQYAYILGPDGAEKRQDRGQLDLHDTGSTFLVNPGSVGQPRDRQTTAAFAMWDRRTNEIHFHRVSYALSSVLDDLRRVGLPEDIAGRLETGW